MEAVASVGERHRVDVVILYVAFNNCEFIAKSLESTNQDRYSLHVLIVNNGEEIPAGAFSSDNQTVLNLKENHGFGSGVNAGIDYLKKVDLFFDYLLIINPDTIFTNGSFRLAMDYISDNGPALYSPVILDSSGLVWFAGGKFSWAKGSAIVPYYGKNFSEIPKEIGNVNFVSGCCMFVPSEYLCEDFYFDDRYFMYEEDVEICIRLNKAGMRMEVIRESFLIHYGQGSILNADEKRYPLLSPLNRKWFFYVFYIFRNRLLTISNHANFSQWLLFLVCSVFFWGRVLFRFFLAKNLKIIPVLLSAFFSFLKLKSLNVRGNFGA